MAGAISPLTRDGVPFPGGWQGIQLQNPILESHFWDHFQYKLCKVELEICVQKDYWGVLLE